MASATGQTDATPSLFNGSTGWVDCCVLWTHRPRPPVEHGGAAYDDIRKDINVLLCVRYVGIVVWQCSDVDDGRSHDGRDDVADGHFLLLIVAVLILATAALVKHLLKK